MADDVFTIAEKYQTLTSGIQATGLGHDTANGYDVMFTLGSGPYNIAQNASVKVVYAFLAGDNQAQLATIGNAAQLKYTEILAKSTTVVPSEYALKQNYPNEAKTYTYIPIDLPEKTNVDITIYDIAGKKISTVASEVLDAGTYRFYVDTSKFPNGIYTYQLKTSNYRQAKKMVVAR